LPGSGWVEFDPTNGIVGNRDLIRIAVARNPDQAIPLSGVYYGEASDELGMEVEVNVKSANSPAEISHDAGFGVTRKIIGEAMLRRLSKLLPDPARL
jgi:transglutaminase-like putative cysteine protease